MQISQGSPTKQWTKAVKSEGRQNGFDLKAKCPCRQNNCLTSCILLRYLCHFDASATLFMSLRPDRAEDELLLRLDSILLLWQLLIRGPPRSGASASVAASVFVGATPLKTILYIAIASSVLTLASAVLAQTDKMAPHGQGEATIYRDLNFQGPAVFVGEAKPNLGLAWPVRSIRVRSGTWELCARTRYRSPCARVSADEADLRNVSRLLYAVQSMRPLGGVVRPPEPPAPPAGQSLRGMSAEFFPAPGVNGYRILSCPDGNSTANCAANTADNFCKSVGYAGSASQTQETVNRRVYLADVLCTRTGY